MEKTLVLVRHAHRDKKAGREVDNGLSAKGRRQARALAKFYARRFDSMGAFVVSSPKLRCVETVEVLPRASRSRLAIDPLLDEGGALSRKVAEFAQWWRLKAPAHTVACSHGDVLPALLKTLVGCELELKKGAWAEVTLNEAGQVSLTWLIQEF